MTMSSSGPDRSRPAGTGTRPISKRTPRRQLFRFFVRHYHFLVALLVSAIVLLSGLPHAPLWTVLGVVVYCVYSVLLHALPRPWVRQQHPAEAAEVLRALGLTLAASTLLFVIYDRMDPEATATVDSLWLLYLLPILLISQRGGDTSQVGLVALASMAALAVVTPKLATHTWWEHVRVLGIPWLWLALLTLIMHTLVRLIGNRSEDLTVLHDLYTQTASVRSINTERAVLQKVVDGLATIFASDHVTVLERQPNGGLLLLVSSAETGRAIAEKGFSLPPDWKGVTGHVLTTGRSYVTNNATRDAIYRRSPNFPATQSELTVPIRVGERLIGLLDIQCDTPGVFGDDDVALCESVAAYVGSLLDNVRLARSYRQVGELFTSIAGRFLSEGELQPTLEEIAATANAELEADIVIVYERDPLTNETRFGAKSGDLRQPDLIETGSARRESMVDRMLASPEDDRFEEIVNDPPPVVPSGRRTFVDREGITSRAVLKLTADSGNVGVMFLNYRSPRHFDPDTQARCRVFASAAALAIQKVHAQEQRLFWQREEFVRELHDRLKGKAFGLSRLVASVRRDANLSDARREDLDEAFEAARELCNTIDELESSREASTAGDIQHEIGRHVRFTQRSYGIAIDVSWPTNPVSLPAVVVREVGLVAGEALGNAARYGAAHVAVSAFMSDGHLMLEIRDNGPGFDPAVTTRGRGLANMRSRVERLGGEFRLVSERDRGTRLSASIPVASAGAEV
jgi:signal transduction histidine kinase